MKAGEYMDVIVHMPTSPEGMEILAHRINEAHLKMVTTNINKLGCPYEHKVELFEAVCEKIEENYRNRH